MQEPSEGVNWQNIRLHIDRVYIQIDQGLDIDIRETLNTIVNGGSGKYESEKLTPVT